MQTVLAGPGSPIEALPNGADMRVFIRRTTRVGEDAGLPVEASAWFPDRTHRLTRNDVLNWNPDLIREAARILSEL